MSFDGWRHECPKHESQETAVYDGETCDACGLSEGEWRLRQATADQLRAECERRGRIVGQSAPSLEAERDDWKRQAQAALVSANNCATARDTYKAERDEWKREHAALNAEYTQWRDRMWKTLRELGCADGVDPEAFLRDLKRRAEAAETRVASLEARIAEGYLPTIVAVQRTASAGFIKMSLARRLLDASTPEEHARFVRAPAPASLAHARARQQRGVAR
jgi:hypothetical protein